MNPPANLPAQTAPPPASRRIFLAIHTGIGVSILAWTSFLYAAPPDPVLKDFEIVISPPYDSLSNLGVVISAIWGLIGIALLLRDDSRIRGLVSLGVVGIALALQGHLTFTNYTKIGVFLNHKHWIRIAATEEDEARARRLFAMLHVAGGQYGCEPFQSAFAAFQEPALRRRTVRRIVESHHHPPLDQATPGTIAWADKPEICWTRALSSFGLEVMTEALTEIEDPDLRRRTLESLKRLATNDAPNNVPNPSDKPGRPGNN